MLFGYDLGLSTGLIVMLGVTLLVVCIFEFVNGFHDTANAVATVIYTGTLKPIQAVVWSGLMNFLGVITSAHLFGMGVAIKIASLLPIDAIMGQDLHHSIAMVISALLGAIIWNITTWYFGIPCSSSHTMIGALLGVGMVFTMMPENTDQAGVNWGEAIKIGQALLFSPAFGFSLAIILMFILRQVIKNKKIFKEPEPGSTPPLGIRAVLIGTCTLVSFFHGSNDGQKGVGLMLIALMTFLPMHFALAPDFDAQKVTQSITTIQAALPQDVTLPELKKTTETLELLKNDVASLEPDNVKQRLNIRKRLGILDKSMKALLSVPNVIFSQASQNTIVSELKTLGKNTSYVPTWCIVLISISLGLGTMIGWKRIVVTIGEKIGKNHLTYAEGATAEIVAAGTIFMASGLSLPVSTTHILSSGVAGAMVATKGTKNLQSGTIKNIAIAWLLTLPATILLAGLMYYILRNII
ncbi:MAG: inorganic phosphate transporter [Bacteroidetes bacterium]|nr:inorganic phosphate transporter [Bacteroidota bacterium]